MIISSLGNAKLEQKYSELLGSDVVAMGFTYWHVSSLKDEQGKTIGTKVMMINKMKPNGWVPDWALSRIQQAQSTCIDALITTLKNKK